MSQSNSIITTASLLCILISIPAIAWRCIYVDQLRKPPLTEWWKTNSAIVGLVAFLITSLIIQIFWLISSIGLLAFGRKGFKPVIWLWVIVTWTKIITDFAFFGYYIHNWYIATNLTQMKDIPQLVLTTKLTWTILNMIQYLLILIVESLLAYLTIRVGHYSAKIKGNGYKQGLVIRTEDQPYLPGQLPPLRQTIVNTQAYQNGGFTTRSADDVRFGIGYGDRPFIGRYRQHPPDEPTRGYNDHRSSRYNADNFRY